MQRYGLKVSAKKRELQYIGRGDVRTEDMGLRANDWNRGKNSYTWEAGSMFISD